MEEEMMNENKEISFGDVIRMILSRKFLALIIAVAITLAGTLALYFGYNAATNYYESSFTVNFTVSSNGIIEYPDGTQRNFRDFISENNLKKVKENYGALADLDVIKMLKDGGISISQQSGEGTNYFTLQVSQKYFSSENVAEIFVDAIVSTVKDDLQNNIVSTEQSVRSGFEKSLGNERKVEFLSKQIEYYTARFNKIKNMSPESIAEINKITYTLNALKGILYTQCYETDVEALKSYENEKVELDRQLKNAQAVLDNLMKSGAGASDGTGSVIVQGAQIVEYTEKVNSLNNKLTYIDKCLVDFESGIPDKITKENYSKYDDAVAFENSLSAVLNDVCELSTVYEAEHWNNFAASSYAGSRLTLVYGLKLVYCILISLLVGLAVAVIVAYLVARSAEKNSRIAPKVEQLENSGEETK